MPRGDAAHASVLRAEGTAVPDARGAEADCSPGAIAPGSSDPARQALRLQLEEIRQLLDLLLRGRPAGHAAAPDARHAQDRLTDMQRQRAELDVAIHDLQSQMGLVEDMLASRDDAQDAAQ